MKFWPWSLIARIWECGNITKRNSKQGTQSYRFLTPGCQTYLEEKTKPSNTCVTQIVCCKHVSQFTDWIRGSTFTCCTYCGCASTHCLCATKNYCWHFRFGHVGFYPSKWSGKKQSGLFTTCPIVWLLMFLVLSGFIVPICSHISAIALVSAMYHNWIHWKTGKLQKHDKL